MADELQAAAIRALEERLSSELVKVREEIPKQLREQIQTARAVKAEQCLEHVYKLVYFYSVGIAILLGILAFLGISSYRDVDKFRTQVSTDADAVASDRRKIDSETEQLEHTLADFQREVAKNRIDTSNIQTSIGTFAGTAPIILRPPITVGRGFLSTIEGKNFGSAAGHLYANVQVGLGGGTSAPVEIRSIQKWNDTSISFDLSDADYSAIDEARRKVLEGPKTPLGIPPISTPAPLGSFISFQVVTSNGASSWWSLATFLP